MARLESGDRRRRKDERKRMRLRLLSAGVAAKSRVTIFRIRFKCRVPFAHKMLLIFRYICRSFCFCISLATCHLPLASCCCFSHRLPPLLTTTPLLSAGHLIPATVSTPFGPPFVAFPPTWPHFQFDLNKIYAQRLQTVGEGGESGAGEWLFLGRGQRGWQKDN